jgi:hypothetical protein
MQQLIFETLYRVATPVGGTTEEYATPEEARDAFIARVMESLFPGFQMPTVDSKTVVVAEPKEKKARKPRSPKKEAEPAAAVVEVPVVAVTESPKKEKKAKKAKKEAEPAVAAEVPLPESPKAEGEKKKRAPMTEEAKAAMKAKREATKAAKAGSPKPVEEPNLKKMDPTWKKHLKTVAKAKSKEVTKEVEADLLSYLNGLTKEEFANKKAEEHVTDFLAPQTASNAAAEPAERMEPVDLDIVEFNGQDYFVGPPLGQPEPGKPPKRRVYEGVGTRDDDTGAYEKYNGIGWVGMAAFEMMKVE